MSKIHRKLPRLGLWAGGVVLLCLAAGCSSQPEMRPLPPLDSVRIAPPSDEYRIQPGDVLRVKFPYHPEHDIKLPVRPDGRLTLDVTGEIAVAGLTTSELAKVIDQRSAQFLRDPEATVIVAQLAEQRVYVGGEVRVPGFVPYRPGLTPMQAILDRGGFTDTAQLDSVLYITPGEADYQATRIDMTDVVNYGVAEPVTMSANDVVYVPRTFVGDAGSFVRLYIRDMLPIPARMGFTP